MRGKTLRNAKWLTKRMLWRWRSNPLRRRDDVAAAWVVLAVWTVVAVGGTLVGFLTAHAADVVYAHQRAQLHSVRAVLTEDAPSAGIASYARVRTEVRWTDADGSVHHGSTLVDAGREAGSKVRIWADAEEKLAPAPATPSEAAVYAALLATATACCLGGMTYAVGRRSLRRLGRRRIEQWGQEWERVGPQWTRRTI
jgi:hypothetical protein